MSRGRKFTRAELEADHARLSEESVRLRRALNAVINGEIFAMERTPTQEDRSCYVFRLLFPTDPDGGILLATFHSPVNRHDSTTVHPADVHMSDRGIATWPMHLRPALARLRLDYSAALRGDRLTPRCGSVVTL